MITVSKRALYFIIFLVFIVAASIYIVGYYTGPGPYLPSEDSFNYTNHHCVPVATNASEIWGN